MQNIMLRKRKGSERFTKGCLLVTMNSLDSNGNSKRNGSVDGQKRSVEGQNRCIDIAQDLYAQLQKSSGNRPGCQLPELMAAPG